jgi:predicted dehydrogenase
MPATKVADVTPISLNEIKEIGVVSGPCVSILIPFETAPDQVEQNRVRLRHAVDAAKKLLTERGVEADRAHSMMHAIHEIAEGLKGDGQGLAVYCAGDFCRAYRLLEPPPESVTVAEHFYIKPLIPLLTADRQFYILALSQKHAHLLRCTGHSSEEVELPESVPKTLWEDKHTDQPDHTQADRSSAGPDVGAMKGVVFTTNTDREDRPEYLAHFYKHLSEGVTALLKDEGAPLVVAGVDYEIAAFKRVNTYPQLVEEAVYGAADGLKGGELRKRALDAEAARKYDRMVQVGLNMRSSGAVRSGARFVQAGGFGTVFRAKAVVFRGRIGIGHAPELPIPNGVHWDLFLGPAPYSAFTLNRFHYGWHYFWDTTTTEVGCNGVHVIDTVRWALGKNVHPVKIHCSGGRFADDSDQDTPNMQNATFEYADGTLVDLEVTTLHSPPFGGIQIGSVFYTTKGYISESGMGNSRWATVLAEFTPGGERDLPSGISQRVYNLSFPKIAYKPGPPIPQLPDGTEDEAEQFRNFIDCVRSRQRDALRCEILEGYRSTALCLLANIAYRTGRKLVFDPVAENFPGDEEANGYLTRKYRAPYTLPDRV